MRHTIDIDIGNQIVKDGYISNNEEEIYETRRNCNPEYYVIYLIDKMYGCVEIFSKLQITKETTRQHIYKFRKKTIQDLNGWYKNLC